MTLQELAPIIELDLERTFALFMGKEEMYIKYLKKFPENVSGLLNELKAAAAESDYHKIETAVHGIKGVAANLGIKPVTALGTDIMRDIRENHFDSIPEYCAQLVEKAELAITYIEKLD
jgi:HPt (histidine-containing phosphotransfer) domain-containing protein